ncbi:MULTISPECIES: response regulator transcription factor [unclassified Marinobacter]|uniref:response regulator transcription factor n=1 Tax=unclassified Marinobacter TaxID=83889 RepID=UPI0026E25304|nr:MULTISPECIES: response regulator [unclassified Marinobacter]MDO6443611.1 response regulator [Marinobacter sp. 2_MG-2023]MDO6825464.1 response regulator [Marinobacter sp. 1_MG-2023]
MAPTSDALMVHIIDDDESVRKGLSRLMRSMGIRSQAYDGSECFLNQNYKSFYGCILIDITMPGMNGFELAARLKADGIAIPMIAISAKDDEETKKLVRDLGVKFFLRKPVDDQALIDAINWVTRKEQPDEP